MSRAHDDALLELFDRWVQAELQGDAAALSTLLDQDFVCVGPLGFVLGREQYIAPRRSGALAHTAFAWEDLDVRGYGDTAVAVGTQRQTSTYQGQDASGRFRATQVLVRHDEGWLIASLHLSPLAEPPGAAGGR